MRFLPLAIACVVAAFSTADARECTGKELVDFKAKQTDFVTFCAVLEENNFHTDTLDRLTPLQLTRIAGCKEVKCLNAIKKLLPDVPDCDIFGARMKRIYETTLTMCERFAVRALTKAEILELFKPFRHAKKSGSSSGSGSETGHATEPVTPAETTSAPVNATEKPVTSENTTTTTTASPVPTPKPTSSASALSVASVVVAVATVAVALV